jgi:DNA polymerase-3 subunit chi
MTNEVAFHFNAPDKLAYACRLLRKAVGNGARVVVLGAPQDMTQLDTLLWSFAALEFVPHCRADAPAELLAHSPLVLASHLDVALPHQEVLVNLGQTMPEGFDAFTRVIEVVSLDEADRQQARQRWKRYTELGYSLVRHDLNLRDTAAG